MNNIFKIIKTYKRFYLCTNGLYRECFFKDEYTPTSNGTIIKKLMYLRNKDNML